MSLRWENIRKLHVSDNNIEDELRSIFRVNQPGSLLDIGTGTARILEVLDPLVDEAEGVYFSHQMLNIARINLDHPALGHCQVRFGNMYQLPYRDKSYDSVIIHHVLHFADHPQEVLREAGRILKETGLLVIVDFLSHQQEDFRTIYQNRRLGFSNEEIENWLGRVGLVMQDKKVFQGNPLSIVVWRACG